MARSKSSRRWLQEHFNDPYVKRAQQDGYRARAAYKLLEIQQRDKILRPGQVVVDLGAAPGSWAQVATSLVAAKGRVIALDILPLVPLPNVQFLQGDFTEADVLVAFQQLLDGTAVDVVLSDMAPNLSGIETADQARAMLLAELAWAFAVEHLKPGGHFLCKVFQGAALDPLVRSIKPQFTRFALRKPAASRARSRELYLLAQGYRPRPCVTISHSEGSDPTVTIAEGT